MGLPCGKSEAICHGSGRLGVSRGGARAASQQEIDAPSCSAHTRPDRLRFGLPAGSLQHANMDGACVRDSHTTHKIDHSMSHFATLLCSARCTSSLSGFLSLVT